MAGMPELGSKISLISKADIRYEGKLFTVDPNECTIALASVRSYGTEDREVDNPVPPQPQIYDFILFRGSDIKDIRVVPNQLPNDPAIVQMTSVPPSMSTSSYQPHGFGLPVLGQIGPSMNQYTNAYNPMSSMAPGMGRTMTKQPQPQQSELVNMVQVPEQVQQSPIKEQRPVNSSELIGGSRSSTPGLLGTRKSPTIDQGIQVSSAPMKDDKSSHSRSMQHQSYNRDGNRSRSGVIGERPYNDNYRGGNERTDYRQQRRDHYNMGNIRQQPQPIGPHSQNPMMRSQGGQNMQGGNRGWINRGGAMHNMRQRGGGRGRMQQGQPNFTRAPGLQPQQQSNNQKKNTLKFEGDYDFDKANTEFEELRSQISKVKISEATETVAKVNGEDKKDDSGNETAIGDGEHDEEHTVYYDKAKSFFDNISCEAVERSKGRSQRTDWRTERKLNSETFGVASARRGGFRGRGGYYNVGRGLYRGGGGGGGYRGNYNHNRGQGNRPRNTNNPSNNNRSQVAAVSN